MKNTNKIIKVLLFWGAAILIFVPNASATDPLIINGSFEDGYDGWTNSESSIGGLWDIVNSVTVTHSEGDLIFSATDGDLMSYYKPGRGGECFSMQQDIALPESAASLSLSWDMFYYNKALDFSDLQYLSVSIQDLGGYTPETLFKTLPGADLYTPTMQTYTHNIIDYAGSNVRIFIDGCSGYTREYLYVGFDNFKVEVVEAAGPPGWDQGKKKGWTDSMPPGLENKDKTPPGFEKGKKSGWK